VDAALDALVLRALARRPEERYPTAAEFARALEEWAVRRTDTAQGVGARQEVTVDTPAVVARPPRRRWVVGLAAGVLAAVVTAVIGFILRDGENKEPPRAPVTGGGPEKGAAPAAPPLVKKLRVLHLEKTAEKYLSREVGADVFAAHLDDRVLIYVDFSEPVYAFLLAFNPDGKEQRCLPKDPGKPPEQRDRLDLGVETAFRLNDGVGLQAFVVVASRQPLPSYAVWKTQRPEVRWQTLPAGEGIVWRSDEGRLEPVTRGEDVRGELVKLEGVAPLAELCRTLRAAPGVEALAVEAFAVLPKKGGE
jgi:hypothetical protein